MAPLDLAQSLEALRAVFRQHPIADRVERVVDVAAARRPGRDLGGELPRQSDPAVVFARVGPRRDEGRVVARFASGERRRLRRHSCSGAEERLEHDRAGNVRTEMLGAQLDQLIRELAQETA